MKNLPTEIKHGNIYQNPPDTAKGEVVEQLLSLPAAGLTVERIYSAGHVSPDGYWYDQECDELVILMQGNAKLDFFESKATVILLRGDWLLIPAHCRHRVSETSLDAIWLALMLNDLTPFSK